MFYYREKEVWALRNSNIWAKQSRSLSRKQKRIAAFGYEFGWIHGFDQAKRLAVNEVVAVRFTYLEDLDARIRSIGEGFKLP